MNLSKAHLHVCGRPCHALPCSGYGLGRDRSAEGNLGTRFPGIPPRTPLSLTACPLTVRYPHKRSMGPPWVSGRRVRTPASSPPGRSKS